DRFEYATPNGQIAAGIDYRQVTADLAWEKNVTPIMMVVTRHFSQDAFVGYMIDALNLGALNVSYYRYGAGRFELNESGGVGSGSEQNYSTPQNGSHSGSR